MTDSQPTDQAVIEPPVRPPSAVSRRRWWLVALVLVLVIAAAGLGAWWVSRDAGGSDADVDAGRRATAQAAVTTWITARNSHTAGAVGAASTADLAFLALPKAWGPGTQPTAIEIFDVISSDPESVITVTEPATMLDSTHVIYRMHAVTPAVSEDTDGVGVWTVRLVDDGASVSQVVWLPDEPGSVPSGALDAVTAWLEAGNAHDSAALVSASSTSLQWASITPVGGEITSLGNEDAVAYLSSAADDQGYSITPATDPVVVDAAHVAAAAHVVDPLHGVDATGLATWTLRVEDGRTVVSQVVWLPDA